MSNWTFTAVRVVVAEWRQPPNLAALLLLPVLAAVGLLGNALVCIAIATDRRLHNVTNYFLFSLALADLFVCCLVMPLSIIVEVKHGVWTWSFSMCLLYVYSDVFLCSASIVHMSIISLDRYLGISQPLKTRNKSKTMILIKIAIVWIVTILISSPLAVIAILDPSNVLQENSCMIFNRYYMIYGSTLSFLIPFFIMAITYVRTTNLLNKQASVLSAQANDRLNGNGLRRTMPARKIGYVNRTSSYNMNGTVSSKMSTYSYNSTANLNHRNSIGDVDVLQQLLRTQPAKERRSTINAHFGRLKTRTSSYFSTIAARVGRKNSLSVASQELVNEHKATRVLAVVFVCFFICWTPFFVANFAAGFCGDACSVPPWLGSLFLWLGYISSTVNPLIYTVFNKRFRQAFVRIIRCQCLHPLRDLNSTNYSRQHTYILPDTVTWSNLERQTTMVRNEDTSLSKREGGEYWRREMSVEWTPPAKPARNPRALAEETSDDEKRPLLRSGLQPPLRRALSGLPLQSTTFSMSRTTTNDESGPAVAATSGQESSGSQGSQALNERTSHLTVFFSNGGQPVKETFL